MINEVIKKLRKAADALDELMDVMPSANMKAARSIRTKVDKNLKNPINSYVDSIKHKVVVRAVKSKKHWTQTPEGRKRMSIAQKKMWAKRKEKK